MRTEVDSRRWKWSHKERTDSIARHGRSWTSNGCFNFTSTSAQLVHIDNIGFNGAQFGASSIEIGICWKQTWTTEIDLAFPVGSTSAVCTAWTTSTTHSTKIFACCIKEMYWWFKADNVSFCTFRKRSSLILTNMLIIKVHM